MPNGTAKTLEQEMVEAIQLSSAALDKAGQEKQAADAVKAAVAREIPALVNALVAANLIEGNEAEKCAEVLLDPVKTLTMFKYAAEKQAEIAAMRNLPARQISSNGATKTASAFRMVGTRTSDDEADRAFDAALGLR